MPPKGVARQQQAALSLSIRSLGATEWTLSLSRFDSGSIDVDDGHSARQFDKKDVVKTTGKLARHSHGKRNRHQCSLMAIIYGKNDAENIKDNLLTLIHPAYRTSRYPYPEATRPL